MMDVQGYGIEAGAVRLGRDDTDEPFLTRISPIASSVEESTARISEFIARCRGGGLVSKGESATTAPMPSGHFAQIKRLDEAAGTLDKLTRELGSIG